MRGEYTQKKRSIAVAEELPPRARRIRILDLKHDIVHGTTSACAENTAAAIKAAGYGGNYLRVRGEYPK